MPGLYRNTLRRTLYRKFSIILLESNFKHPSNKKETTLSSLMKLSSQLASSPSINFSSNGHSLAFRYSKTRGSSVKHWRFLQFLMRRTCNFESHLMLGGIPVMLVPLRFNDFNEVKPAKEDKRFSFEQLERLRISRECIIHILFGRPSRLLHQLKSK